MKKILFFASIIFTIFNSNAQCVSTLAGSGVNGYADGTGISAKFFVPNGIAVDGLGNIFIADESNHRIRKITPAGVVTTFAGSGSAGYFDGTGTSAWFRFPRALTIDSSGNLYVADNENHRIRKITSAGVVTTLAGSGTSGFADGTGTSAKFFQPSGIAVDAMGNIYVADWKNFRIRKITSNGVVTTLAGSGVSGIADGNSISAEFVGPWGIAVDGLGNVFVGDTTSIRKITSSGIVTTLAPNIGARGIAVDSFGNIFVASPYSSKIQKVTSSGIVNTLAGSGVAGYSDGNATSAQFYQPFGITINNNNGEIYVSESYQNNNRVRKITPNSSSANINYMSSPFCMSLSSPQSVTLTGTGAHTGGVYSSTTGLTINATSGAITPSSSTPGIYTVTYNTPSNGGCYISATAQVTITAIPTASINYTGSPFCKSLTTGQLVALTGSGDYIGGTYTSTAGLSINATTGAINPSLSTAETYTVTYTTTASGGCTSISTTRQITITATPTVSISYSVNEYCKWISNSQTVSITGTGVYLGGTFITSPAGLSINSTTGAINPSLSSSGTYVVIYDKSPTGGCSTITNTTTVTILPLSTISAASLTPTLCVNTQLTPILHTTSGATGIGTASDLPAGINATWNANNIIISGTPTVSGTFNYSIPLKGGCGPVIAFGTITILPILSSSISADGTTATNITVNSGNVVQLQLNSSFGTPANIQWSPNVGISSTSISNPLVYPTSTTTYYASFFNTNGCQQSTSITVNVTPQPNIGTISLSSPNTGTIGLFDTITVNVQLTNATDLYSLYMKLKGNAAVSQYLDYSTYTAGYLLGTSNVISTPPTVINGVPDFGMTKVGAAPGYSGSGLFYTFTFVPKNIFIPDGTVFCFYMDDVISYNSSGTSCGLNNQGPICYTFTNQINVWPGDLNKSNTVTTADILPIGYFYNSTGPARSNANIQWTAQPATLWGYNHSATNGDSYKVFADSNGDGVINNADQAAIGFNMNKIHARLAAPITVKKNNTSRLAVSSGSLVVTPNTTIVNASLLPQTVTFTVNLNNSGGLSALYGISVNLVFDETIFDLANPTVDYKGSIFGAAGTDCLVMNYASGKMVSVGLTRYANAAINGQGLLFKVTLQTKSTLTKSLTQTPVTAYVDAANNKTGDTLVVQEAPVTNFTIINNLGIDTIKQDEFVLYPNPASDLVCLVLGTNTAQMSGLKLKVFNILGQTVDELHIENSTMEISTKNWGTSGIYFMHLTDENNTVLMTEKVIVNRK